MRHIKQISTVPTQDSYIIIALCDDGSLWEYLEGSWTHITLIPQGSVEKEEEKTR